MQASSPTVTALERFEPAPYVPPKLVVALTLAITFGLALWFVLRGLIEVGDGRQELAATLLDVRARQGSPIDFELTTMTGETVRLGELGNKTVFINFWATWCPPCVEEMPSLRRLAQRLQKNPDFVFLAISTDEEWGVVRRFFDREPAPFPVLLDAEGLLAKRYGTTKFPETYIVQDGELVGHIIGPRDWDVWYAEAWLKGLLEEGRT